MTTTDVSSVVNFGSTQIGVPYQMGSAAGRSIFDTAKQVYFDCSGFVAWAYYQATGVKLPAYTDALANDARLTEVPSPQVGDIVLFRFHDSGQPGVTFPHTALYAGNNMVIESGSANAAASKVGIRPLLSALDPHFFRLKSQVITNPPIVGPVPIPSNGQIPIPGISTPTPTPTPTTTTPMPVSGIGAGQIGPWPINLPSGLILALLGVFLLLLGALLFGFNVKSSVTNVAASAVGGNL